MRSPAAELQELEQPADADVQRAPDDGAAAKEAPYSDEELQPGTPPTSGQGRRSLDTDREAIAAEPMSDAGAPWRAGSWATGPATSTGS